MRRKWEPVVEAMTIGLIRCGLERLGGARAAVHRPDSGDKCGAMPALRAVFYAVSALHFCLIRDPYVTHTGTRQCEKHIILL